MKTYHERSQDVAVKLEELKKKRRIRRRAITGISLCLVAVLTVVLLIPYDKNPPSVEHHARDPYYEVIQTLNRLTYSPPKYDNAAQEIFGNMQDAVDDMMAVGGDAPMDAGNNMSGAVAELGTEYVEVTDNQVQGVVEADIFKRSSQYLYYLSGTELTVYAIAGEASEKVGFYQLDTAFGQTDRDSYDFYSTTDSEMYLSADCTTVTLVLLGYNKADGAVTAIVNLDVSDPENITQIDYVLFPGSLISTRMAEGKLLLTYNFRVSNADFDEPETFVPSYGKVGEMTCVEPKDVICPDTATDTRYTVVCQLDSKTLEVEDSKALLSYAQELYVSQNAIYATHSFSEKQKVDADVYYTQTMTTITGIGYGDKLQYLGSIDIEGSVTDQYSMDEYEDILRVVTNTSMTHYEEYKNKDTVGVQMSASRRNVDLYCIDLKAWKVEALVGGFAPEGETAESVRFDGTMAYVCTAEVITLTDPVYFFDLTDLENITWTDTGTIDGYSSSLVQLGDGFLMGIGYGDAWQLKIEIYEEYKDEVVSVDAWEEEAEFSEEYKSYLIDRENDLVGLALYRWYDRKCEYLLLHFDGYKLQELARVALEDWNPHYTRACIIDDYLYILTPTGLTVEQVW